MTAKPNTLHWLATIIAKAQGVIPEDAAEPIDIGDEVGRIRREYDALRARVEVLESALTEIADELDRDGRFPNTVPEIRAVLGE